MSGLRDGYILHSDPNWVSFHLANSSGKVVGYCRGAGAPMKNVRPGGKLFFVSRSGGAKRISFWADFVDDPLVTVDEAWDRFGQSLGVATREEWHALVNRLPAIKAAGRLRVIRGENAYVPFEPVSIRDAGLTEIRNATKGWSITRDDVARLLQFAGGPTASDVAAPPAERVRMSVSRIIRDTALARDVKRRHQYLCQICGETIRLADGSAYAEGHHVQPLGEPHNGPDILENILCLCPNHHAACDLGAIRLDGSALRVAAGHTVGAQFLAYHNRALFGGSAELGRPESAARAAAVQV